MKREGEFRGAGKLPELSCRHLGGVGAGEGRENLRRRGPSNASSEARWYPSTPLKQGASGTEVLTHLPLFLGLDRMAERRIRKEREISRMSACKKARGDASDPEKWSTNSVEGYPQAAAARILNNPSAAFVDNPRRGVDDL